MQLDELAAILGIDELQHLQQERVCWAGLGAVMSCLVRL